MLSLKTGLVALVYLSTSSLALPIRREVPQEHSHEPFLTSVRASLALDNPLNLGDPVFALLGNAAAANGLGDLEDPDCLQQAIADQAFTNAKAAGDLQSQVDALIFRALERNSGAVGQTTALCESVQAVNPEIAAIQQHQDPASDGAAELNKDIALALARQIASIGGDPQQALLSGTFEPGEIGDPTAAGNTCNDANNLDGCIFTEGLLVEDATAEEIDAAVAGIDAGVGNDADANEDAAEDGAVDETCPPAVTVTVTASADEATETAADEGAAEVDAGAEDGAAEEDADAGDEAASGANLQSFAGALGGAAAPAVVEGGRGFQVEGSDDFLNIGAALNRSCDIQHNACANLANSGADFSVGDCDTQNSECKAAI